MDSRLDRATILGWLVALLGCVIAAACLLHLHDPAHLNADVAQYISTAVNVASGDGLTSDIIHYDEQFRFQVVPSPQTVFPPGLPLVLALVFALGLEPVDAPFLVALIGFLGVAALLFASLLRMQVGPLLAALGSLVWLTSAYAWGNILLGLSEMVFTLATLGAAALCVRGHNRVAVLAGAGALAAIAVLVRYQGIFFVVALLVWLALYVQQPWRGDLRRLSRDVALLLGLPLAVFALLTIRNSVLTGTPGGGPIDTVQQGVTGLSFVKEAYWAFSSLAGLKVDRLVQGALAEVLLLTSVVAIAGCWALRPGNRSLRSCASEESSCSRERSTLACLALAYLLVSGVALGYLAASRSPLYLQGRFIVPLLPFAIVLWIIFVSQLHQQSAGYWRGIVSAAVVAFHFAVFLGQGNALTGVLDNMKAQPRLRVINEALAEQMNGVTLRVFLGSQTSRDQPLVADLGQYVWLDLRRPILSLTPADLSSRVWDEEAFRHLQRQYGARYVLFFPELFNPDLPGNANKVVFQKIFAGQPSGFLKPVHIGRHAALFVMDFDRDGGLILGPNAASRSKPAQQ